MIRPASTAQFDVRPTCDGGFEVVAVEASSEYTGRVTVAFCDTEAEAVDVSTSLSRAAEGL